MFFNYFKIWVAFYCYGVFFLSYAWFFNLYSYLIKNIDFVNFLFHFIVYHDLFLTDTLDIGTTNLLQAKAVWGILRGIF